MNISKEDFKLKKVMVISHYRQLMYYVKSKSALKSDFACC